MQNVLLCNREKQIEMILMCKRHSVILAFLFVIHFAMLEVVWNKQQQQQQQK